MVRFLNDGRKISCFCSILKQYHVICKICFGISSRIYLRDRLQISILILTFSWRRPLSYRIETSPLICSDWFLYDNGLRHERVKRTKVNFNQCKITYDFLMISDGITAEICSRSLKRPNWNFPWITKTSLTWAKKK